LSPLIFAEQKIITGNQSNIHLVIIIGISRNEHKEPFIVNLNLFYYYCSNVLQFAQYRKDEMDFSG